MNLTKIEDIKGLKVTIMGLGLHGGGFASAYFFASHGAEVTVTDLRTKEVLEPSMNKLFPLPIRYVLGHHDIQDFKNADLVIKNPAVRANSLFLEAAKQVETDISIFLRLYTSGRIIAVTGSKGKSTTVSAIYHVLKRVDPRTALGGNITVSPLSFIDKLKPGSPIILELSSWQLADLRGKGLLRPEVSLITNILPDHQNAYSSLEEYAADKQLIYADQKSNQYTLVNYDDEWGSLFSATTPATAVPFSLKNPELSGIHTSSVYGWINKHGQGLLSKDNEIVGLFDTLSVKGEHFRLNMLCAGMSLFLFGISPQDINKNLSDFSGIAHRMEHFYTWNKIDFYNDSAATIPQACEAAIKSFTGPVILVTGGTDKNLDFDFMAESYKIPKKIFLLAGTATDKIIPVLEKAEIPFEGPYNDLIPLLEDAKPFTAPGDTVILSPGCASFGLFLNEFDRGNQFKEDVEAIFQEED